MVLEIKHFVVFATIFFIGYSVGINEAQATGGAGQIAGKIMSILEDAQTYLNEGDTQAAQKEIQDAINELKDTYEADQK